MTEKIDSPAGYFLAGPAIGSLIAIFFAPKSGEGTRAYLSKRVKEGGKLARKKARELRARAEDLVDSGKELVNQKKEQIAAKLEEAGEDDVPEKSKAKGVYTESNGEPLCSGRRSA
jgi:gas vesicle protein